MDSASKILANALPILSYKISFTYVGGSENFPDLSF